ncbi:30S ribosomal protein S15 [Melia azedarach]|uniref:30S ribosomal protein S15 n=1 Tax=Melia azedarach TaxID=155640 RepID=A0ACC1Y543_MELAZ|nr:30S ribosomal protein S15 [Melia azedarach]
MIVYSNSPSNRVLFLGRNSNRNSPLNPQSYSLRCPNKNPSFCDSQSQSSMALHLCQPKNRYLSNPSLIHLFSTSQNDVSNNINNTNNNDEGNANNSSPSSLNSYFSDVKASLRKPQQNQTTSFAKGPSKLSSIEEIRKNLAEFRQRSAAPSPTETNSTASQSQHISFQELYKRNTNTQGKPNGKLTFDAIRESMRKMRSNNSNNANRSNVGSSADSLSLSAFKNSLKLKPGGGNTNTVIGGTQELPLSVFGKEMKGGELNRERMKLEFVKTYEYAELGEKLRKLRPEGSARGFSLGELNERLMKLRQIEEENESRIGGIRHKDIRESLFRLKTEEEEEKARKSSAPRFNILSQLGGTPSFMLHPPKEQLVEKYFHPDNMSSEEKMKIELAKVREEFKMSESDCGSSRVQIAQLTTKIKHLSSVLHKKGLQAMVQKRKRLLKYLRRTDWDSYCLVLSKLGLRDNPDYKF